MATCFPETYQSHNFILENCTINLANVDVAKKPSCPKEFALSRRPGKRGSPFGRQQWATEPLGRLHPPPPAAPAARGRRTDRQCGHQDSDGAVEQRCPGPRRLGILNKHTRAHAGQSVRPEQSEGACTALHSFPERPGSLRPGASIRDPTRPSHHDPPPPTHSHHVLSIRTHSPADSHSITIARAAAFPKALSPAGTAAFPAPQSLPGRCPTARIRPASLGSPRRGWRGRRGETLATPKSPPFLVAARRWEETEGKTGTRGQRAGRKTRGAKVQAARSSAALSNLAHSRGSLSRTRVPRASAPEAITTPLSAPPPPHSAPAFPPGATAGLELGCWRQLRASAQAESGGCPPTFPGPRLETSPKCAGRGCVESTARGPRVPHATPGAFTL
jgi:hypothetical protein